MKTRFIILSCFLLTGSLFAQTNKIITSGKIEFEKRINMHAVSKNEIGEGVLTEFIKTQLDNYKRSSPQFATLNSTLIFNDNKTLFTPIAPTTPIANFNSNPIARQFNIVYTDLATNAATIQKEISGEFFLVKDSTRNITWKLTDETQEVAGYSCRRANGLMLDSIYVVAYYTDKIWVSGGPESFAGLPGMILKVAVPHENVIWTATKVTVENIPPATIVAPAPKKATQVNNKQMYDILKKYTKSWGSVGPYEMKIFFALALTFIAIFNPNHKTIIKATQCCL